MKSNHLVFKVTYHIGIDIDNDDDNDDVNYYDYDDEREWYRQWWLAILLLTKWLS